MGLCALDGISLEVIDDTLDFNGQPPLGISVDDDGIMTARMGISEDPANFDNTDADILAEIPYTGGDPMVRGLSITRVF